MNYGKSLLTLIEEKQIEYIIINKHDADIEVENIPVDVLNDRCINENLEECYYMIYKIFYKGEFICNGYKLFISSHKLYELDMLINIKPDTPMNYEKDKIIDISDMNIIIFNTFDKFYKLKLRYGT